VLVTVWRRIAAATYPDRGDAARFAAAAAAYTALRTNFGHAEAVADLARPARSGRMRWAWRRPRGAPRAAGRRWGETAMAAGRRSNAAALVVTDAAPPGQARAALVAGTGPATPP